MYAANEMMISALLGFGVFIPLWMVTMLLNDKNQRMSLKTTGLCLAVLGAPTGYFLGGPAVLTFIGFTCFTELFLRLNAWALACEQSVKNAPWNSPQKAASVEVSLNQ